MTVPCIRHLKLYSFACTKSCINTLVMILSRRSNHILINRILLDSHSDRHTGVFDDVRK